MSVVMRPGLGSTLPAGKLHNQEHHLALRAAQAVSARPMDAVLFGLRRVQELAPPSRTFQVQSASGRTLNLRQWWPRETMQPTPNQPGKVFFLVHGLSSRSDWMAPEVDELMALPENQGALYYGIDLPSISRSRTGEGHLEDIEADLLHPVREAIELLAVRHGGPVHGIGMSLGGLLLGTVAADNPPEAIRQKGIALLSPAFKPHPDTFWNAVRDGLGKLFGKRRGRSFFSPNSPAPSSEAFTPLQQAVLDEKAKARDKVLHLDFPSSLKLYRHMQRFCLRLASRLTIPVRLFGTQTDHVSSPKAIVSTFNRFPSPDKALHIIPKGLHDLGTDPFNRQMVREISRFFARD